MATTQLPPEIFDVQTNVPLIHQVVVAQLAAARSGTHRTKTRAEVAGGGRKPYRQKGTGRARQGSVRAPQYAGGGTVHGPKPRDYSQRTPKKMRAAALRGVLSDRAREDRVHVVDTILDAEAPSTKAALSALGEWASEPRLLVVLDRSEGAAWRSLRNVPTLALVSADQLSAYDAVVSNRVVFTKAALDAFVTRSIGIAPVQPEDAPAGEQAEAEPQPAEGASSDAASSSPEHVEGDEPDGAAPGTPADEIAGDAEADDEVADSVPTPSEAASDAAPSDETAPVEEEQA